MCGIAGFLHLDGQPITLPEQKLDVMNRLLAHRGPDDEGQWIAPNRSVGLVHRRLSIVDLSEAGAQPMISPSGAIILHNGEVYNAPELREALTPHHDFKGHSDTESMLAAYDRYGLDFVDHLRGMFGCAIWDPNLRRLIGVRDRFGIKPFYYAVVDRLLVFASEAKAILPFLDDIETDPDALAEYLTFQYTIGEQTLFRHIKQLMPAHMLIVENGEINIRRYWDVDYSLDWDHSERYFLNELPNYLHESVDVHLRSDVPVATYLSGGIDSSIITMIAAEKGDAHESFHGKFVDHQGFDESAYARAVAERAGTNLNELVMTAADFRDNIERLIYHLDFPVAGPGSFPQFMVSKLAASKVKVIVGGQGGDEIFGGYARYLVAYLEQCLKASIDGTYKRGNFVVTLESILPNLPLLQEYKPMIKGFWKENLFGELDERYFRLIDRSADMADEVNWAALDKDRVFEAFRAIFNSRNVGKEAYFDKMTHFDFKCLLPALLHVEDRVSMAHGLESRVPFLDHKLVEFAATVPADVKYQGGQQKRMLKSTFGDLLPRDVLERRDKMGFPVPLNEWFKDELKGFMGDLFGSRAARERPFFYADKALEGLTGEARFSRKTWGLMGLELWHQTFHDKAHAWREMINGVDTVRKSA
ncbi:MAG: asparagine synthase (glutamine-hydrolyzing) [Pseudomonadota bacterium]